MQYCVERVIPETHPSLPGHFPGNPVVPGVVILDAVLQALREWLPGSRVNGIPEVKFVATLLPERPFVIEFRQEESVQPIRFECRSGERRVAQGRLVLAPVAGA